MVDKSVDQALSENKPVQTSLLDVRSPHPPVGRSESHTDLSSRGEIQTEDEQRPEDCLQRAGHTAAHQKHPDVLRERPRRRAGRDQQLDRAGPEDQRNTRPDLRNI